MYMVSNFIIAYSMLFSQIALNVSEKGNQLGNFSGLFDLPEQAIIRKECKATVGMSINIEYVYDQLLLLIFELLLMQIVLVMTLWRRQLWSVIWKRSLHFIVNLLKSHSEKIMAGLTFFSCSLFSNFLNHSYTTASMPQSTVIYPSTQCMIEYPLYAVSLEHL